MPDQEVTVKVRIENTEGHYWEHDFEKHESVGCLDRDPTFRVAAIRALRHVVMLLKATPSLPTLWKKYGLSIDRGIVGDEYVEACRAHSLVANYLEAHLDKRQCLNYRGEGTGYYFILRLAEEDQDVDYPLGIHNAACRGHVRRSGCHWPRRRDVGR